LAQSKSDCESGVNNLTRKYRSTAMALITLLEHLRVIIIQEAAKMIINGRTHYLFLNPVFSCNLFKGYAKVMRVKLNTIHETEKTVDVFSDEFENKINDLHSTFDLGLQKIASTINSSKHTSKENHNSVMKGMNQLITKGDIRKTVDAISGPTKCHNIVRALM
jgi:hypothetical protein